MEFNIRYLYKKGRNPTGSLLVSLVIFALGLMTLALNLWSVRFREDLIIVIVLFIMAAIMFPYGTNSIYMDDEKIRFIRWKYILSYILPIRITISVNSDMEIRYDSNAGIIWLGNDVNSGTIDIRKADEKVKKEILDAINQLTKAYKKIKKATRNVEPLFDLERISVNPGKKAVFKFNFQAGDYLLGTAGRETDEPYNYRLFNQKNYNMFLNGEQATGIGEDNILESNIEWTVDKNGEYFLVVDNLNGHKTLIAVMDLNRTHESKSNEDDFIPANKERLDI